MLGNFLLTELHTTTGISASGGDGEIIESPYSNAYLKSSFQIIWKLSSMAQLASASDCYLVIYLVDIRRFVGEFTIVQRNQDRF